MIEGIVGYPVTPFDADYKFDPVSFGRLIDMMIENGVDAISPLGSTGESAYLSFAEWEAVTLSAMRAVDARVPVMIGVSDVTTEAVIRRAKVAKDGGAAAIMLSPVCYWKLTYDEILSLFEAVSTAVDIPIMAYNNPSTTGIDMTPEFLVKLWREIDHVAMVKDSSGYVSRFTAIATLSKGELPTFAGYNPLSFHALAGGAAGWCTAAACLAPNACVQMYRKLMVGRLESARDVYVRLAPLLQCLVENPIPSVVKPTLEQMGYHVGRPRLPLQPADAEHAQYVAGLAREAEASAS